VGKSTFASTMPEPVIIPTERGVDQITVARFKTPETFAELWKMVVALDTEEHNYQSIILDTIDATELLIANRIIEEGGPNCKTLEAYGGGYNKWVTREREIWTGLITKLSEMSERFNILLIGHSQLKNVIDPMLSATYDQYRIKIQEKSADVIRQAVDMILFANLNVDVAKDSPRARKGRGIVSGDRLMYTSSVTGVESKNRFNLPNPMPFEWSALEQAVAEFYDK
jgi:hypothetical protein